jgi:hypothetical protein
MNWPKDVVRRAANIQEDSCSSFVDSLLEALRPPLLRNMQDIGHCILSPLKKRVPAGHIWRSFGKDIHLFYASNIIIR